MLKRAMSWLCGTQISAHWTLHLCLKYKQMRWRMVPAGTHNLKIPQARANKGKCSLLFALAWGISRLCVLVGTILIHICMYFKQWCSPQWELIWVPHSEFMAFSACFNVWMSEEYPVKFFSPYCWVIILSDGSIIDKVFSIFSASEGSFSQNRISYEQHGWTCL